MLLLVTQTLIVRACTPSFLCCLRTMILLLSDLFHFAVLWSLFDQEMGGAGENMLLCKQWWPAAPRRRSCIFLWLLSLEGSMMPLLSKTSVMSPVQYHHICTCCCCSWSCKIAVAKLTLGGVSDVIGRPKCVISPFAACCQCYDSVCFDFESA